MPKKQWVQLLRITTIAAIAFGISGCKDSDDDTIYEILAYLNIIDEGLFVNEGDSIDINVTLSKACDEDVTFNAGGVTDDTVFPEFQASGDDYDTTDGIFLKGETATTFEVMAVLDDLAENDESFRAAVTSVSGQCETNSGNPKAIEIEDGLAQVTIIDSIHLTIEDLEVSEDVGNAEFTVNISEPCDSPFEFEYSTANGGAVEPGDYTAVVSGAGSISAGASSTTVAVAIIDDIEVEDDETFTVSLAITGDTSCTTNAHGTRHVSTNDSATGTILANDLI